MILFVGGIRDGDWFDVPSDRVHWTVSERPKLSILSFDPAVIPEVCYHRQMCYSRMHFRGSKDTYSIFAAPGLTPDRVLSRLVAGYAGTGEDCE